MNYLFQNTENIGYLVPPDDPRELVDPLECESCGGDVWPEETCKNEIMPDGSRAGKDDEGYFPPEAVECHEWDEYYGDHDCKASPDSACQTCVNRFYWKYGGE